MPLVFELRPTLGVLEELELVQPPVPLEEVVVLRDSAQLEHTATLPVVWVAEAELGVAVARERAAASHDVPAIQFFVDADLFDPGELVAIPGGQALQIHGHQATEQHGLAVSHHDFFKGHFDLRKGKLIYLSQASRQY